MQPYSKEKKTQKSIKFTRQLKNWISHILLVNVNNKKNYEANRFSTDHPRVGRPWPQLCKGKKNLNRTQNHVLHNPSGTLKRRVLNFNRSRGSLSICSKIWLLRFKEWLDKRVLTKPLSIERLISTFVGKTDDRRDQWLCYTHRKIVIL